MMAACPDQSLVLGALVDGELDAANTALAEAHAARCEGCREELERLQAVRTLLRGDGVRHTAPETLRRRVAALPETRGERPLSNFLPGWLAPGVAGAVAASLALVMLVPHQEGVGLDRQLVSSHVRSLQPGHLTDVQTTDQHVVKPWFNGRIDFSPPVPELATDGFPLVGGRLDAVDGKTVAAIVYKRRLHIVNLFVWRAAAAGERAVEEDGFAVTAWSAGGVRFAAVSDIAPQELGRFEATFRDRTK
jgi:anti-sigma factor RsiW